LNAKEVPPLSDATAILVKDWVLFLISNAILGASIMMLFTGKLPPLKVKVPAIISTGVFVVGMTMMLVYGSPDLLQQTIGLFVK
jgi:hypothetical protein